MNAFASWTSAFSCRLVLTTLAAWCASCASACTPRAPPRARQLEPTSAWIVDPKVEADAQEFLVRAYDEELVFPFRVRTRQGETIVTSKPRDLVDVVSDPSVMGVSCAAPSSPAPTDDAWRSHVDAELRTIYAASSTCYAAVSLRFGRDASVEDKAMMEALGAVLKAFDARTAIAWVPVRALPTLGSLELVDHVDRD